MVNFSRLVVTLETAFYLTTSFIPFTIYLLYNIAMWCSPNSNAIFKVSNSKPNDPGTLEGPKLTSGFPTFMSYSWTRTPVYRRL